MITKLVTHKKSESGQQIHIRKNSIGNIVSDQKPTIGWKLMLVTAVACIIGAGIYILAYQVAGWLGLLGVGVLSGIIIATLIAKD